MPTLRWRTSAAAGHDDVAIAMVSRFVLRRYRDVPRFLIDSLRVHRQVLAAQGVIGASLRARPIKREFLTLSAWRDLDALHRLRDREPHASVMRRHGVASNEATFVYIEARTADLPLSWVDVRRRLDAEQQRRAARTALRNARVASRTEVPAPDAT